MGAWVIESAPPSPDRSAFALGKGFNVSIAPEDQVSPSPAPDSTRQVAENLFTFDNDLTMGESTTCATNAGPVAYVSSKRRASKRSRTALRASCKGSKNVVSGGAVAGGPFRSQRLVAGVPFDSKDPGSKPDDGWRVVVDNLSAKRRAVQAYAICATAPGARYVAKGFKSKRRSRHHTELSCPPGEYIVGGGVAHAAPYRKATLVASRFKFGDNDTWIVEVDNLSRKRAAGRAFAICHA